MECPQAETEKQLKPYLRRALSLAVTAMAVLTALVAAPASPAMAANGRSICYNSYLQDLRWQGLRCDGPDSGTTGQGRRIEAILLTINGVGGYCASAHVQDSGWQGQECSGDGGQVILGTWGSGKRIEALIITVFTGQVCGEAHVQGLGWMGRVCGQTIWIGTSFESRRLEAFRLTV